MNFKVFFCLLTAPVITGCVSEFNAKLPSSDTQILIVDGNVVENSEATFYLSKSFPVDSLVIPKKSFDIDAKLTLIGSNGYESAPATNSGKGVYRLYVGELDDNAEYGIRIEYDGNTYQSALAKPLYTPEIDSVSWIQPEKEGPVFFRVSTHDTDTNEAKFFSWSYTENWEITARYYTTLFFNSDSSSYYFVYPPPYFYCWKSSESNVLLVGSTESLKENRVVNKPLYQQVAENSRFSVLYCVTVTQKAISKGAYDYYRNKISLNEEMGGLFTPQPAELTGNISCRTDPSKKVMGYIEISKNFTQKRLFVSAEQIKRPAIYDDCTALSSDSVNAFLNEREMTYADFYSLGFRPAGSNMDMKYYPKIVPEQWAKASCTDCTYNGTKDKPDFWPNDHQ